jgi:ribosomal protein S27AE
VDDVSCRASATITLPLPNPLYEISIILFIINQPTGGNMPGLEMKYFVLKPSGNTQYHHASRVAMHKYAEIIKSENPELSSELIEWVDREIENNQNYRTTKQGRLEDSAQICPKCGKKIALLKNGDKTGRMACISCGWSGKLLPC